MSGLVPLPLAGKRIVVTRARSQASSLVVALTELGADVVELPTIEIIPPNSYEALDQALRNIQQYRWLIATSANTVRILSARLAALEMPLSTLSKARLAAIGSATARAFREHGIKVDVVPEQYVAESLVALLGDQVSGSRILLARAAVARDVVPQELARRGAIVDIVDAYRTVIPKGAVDRLREVFLNASLSPHAITFTSSSTVTNFFALWREAGFTGIPGSVAALSIGPVTSRTLRQFNWVPSSEAATHNIEGILDTVISALR